MNSDRNPGTLAQLLAYQDSLRSLRRFAEARGLPLDAIESASDQIQAELEPIIQATLCRANSDCNPRKHPLHIKRGSDVYRISFEEGAYFLEWVPCLDAVQVPVSPPDDEAEPESAPRLDPELANA